MLNNGGVLIRRNFNGDRFYNPPPVRRQRRKMLQQQQEEQRIKDLGGLVISEKRHPHHDGCASSSSVSEAGSGCSVTRDVVDDLTNLDRFLECTTPYVQAHIFPETSTSEWRNHGGEFYSYFVLRDLWESFKQGSAYGVGVPILLNGSDSVVQYYVPYLSGIQLYIDPSRLRSPGEDSDTESCRKLTSDGSNGRELERGVNDVLNEPMSKLNLTSADSPSYDTHSLQKELAVALVIGECETVNSPGQLIYEYLERDPPFGREPLAHKISVLESKFPDLGTYRSCDLMPSSWISVAWYPIYRIPTGPTLQNLDACFLTFHSLSTPLKNTDTLHKSAEKMKLSLPTYGLASYKYKVSVWNPNELCQKTDSLLLAADHWLRHLQVNHPDYTFFVSHSSYSR